MSAGPVVVTGRGGSRISPSRCEFSLGQLKNALKAMSLVLTVFDFSLIVVYCILQICLF